MAIRKTTSKTSKKASFSFDWDNNSKQTKRSSKKAKKQLKKLGFGAIMMAIFMLAIGAAGGFFGVKFLTKKDCFELIGKDEITLQLGETYLDEGANIVSFGKDVSADVEIETNLKIDLNGKYYAESEGTYYMIYKSKNFKYGTLFKVQKIRLITFVDATEPGEMQQSEGGVDE